MTARTQAVLLALCGVLAVTLLILRIDVVHALLIALGGVVVVVGSAALHQSAYPEVLHGRGLAADGARRDVAALSWTLVGRNGRVSESAVRHLRATAQRRLARVGLRLDLTAEPRVLRALEEKIGSRAMRTLRATSDMPTMDDVAHTVAVLERLVPPVQPLKPVQLVSPTPLPSSHDREKPRR